MVPGGVIPPSYLGLVPTVYARGDRSGIGQRGGWVESPYLFVTDGIVSAAEGPQFSGGLRLSERREGGSSGRPYHLDVEVCEGQTLQA